MVIGRKTLLAKLAPAFGPQTENLAVEALGHIFSESETARRGLSEVVHAGGAEVGQIVHVHTQVASEGGERPDLVGFDRDGKERVLIEAKFWAGLTKNQPVGYLKRLEKPSARQPSALVVVAPATRMDVLWGELCREVSKSADVVLGSQGKQKGLRSAAVGAGRYLMLTSWRSLLGRTGAQVAAEADDPETEADIRQLLGLAEQQDDEAFLPLTREELGPQLARRVVDLKRLVEGVVNRTKEADWASTGPMASTGASYGVWMRLSRAEKADVYFGVDYARWARYGGAPLWLVFYREHTPDDLRLALEPLRHRNPPELIGEPGQNIKVPIELPVGKDYDVVLDNVFDRVQEIVRLVAP